MTHNPDLGTVQWKEVPSKPTRSIFNRNAARWILAFAILTVFLHFYGLHSHWGNADQVRGILQGADVARGNIFLNHWYSGADNFLTTDVLLFSVGVLLFGSKLALLHWVSAVVWAALVVAAVYVTTIDLSHWATFVAISIIVVTLVFTCPLLSQNLSQSMTHVATTLYVLLAFIALCHGGFGWGWSIGVVLLAAVTFGDPLAVAFGIAPVLGAGILDAIRRRDWRRSLATTTAPLAAIAIWILFRIATEWFGTFRISSTARLATNSQLIGNAHTILPDVLSIFGLNQSLRSSGVPWELEIVRVVGLLAATIGIVVALGCLLFGLVSAQPRTDLQGMAGRSDASYRLSDFLILAVVGDAMSYALLSLPGSGLRYLTPGVVFASILGAVAVGQYLQQSAKRRVQRLMLGFVALLVACCGSCVGLILAQSVPTSPYSGLVGFLESHDLDRGVGDYWTSAPVTVYSEGQVMVRQVIPSIRGGLEPYLVLSKTTWYTGKFQFLVYNFEESAYGVAVHYGEEIRMAAGFPFSRVARTYRYHSFRIIVWKSPLTIAQLERVRSST